MISFLLLAVSVHAFGAIPNDGKDDTAAIQLAINTATLVDFPSGVYNVDGLTITKQGVCLQGEPGATLVRVRQAKAANLIELKMGVHALTLDGLTIDGNEAEQPKRYSASVRTTLSNQITIKNCSFFRGADRAIDIRGGQEIRIQDCRFIDCGLAIPSGNNGNAISVDRNGSDRPKEVIVTGNYCRGFGDCAIGVPSSDYVLIANNIVVGDPAGGKRTESGISVNSSTNCTITGNLVRDCAAGGLFLWDMHPAPMQNISAVGNTIVNSRVVVGFTKPDSHSLTLVGNVLDNSLIGVMGDHGKDMVIVGNIARSQTHGILLTGKGHADHLITGNVLEGRRPIEKQRFVQPGLIQLNIERPIEQERQE